jgi:putative ABC transport system permease protein
MQQPIQAGKVGAVSAVRRVRAFAGQFALLAVLALVVALLITAAPTLANRSADQGLRNQIAAQPVAVRDITYQETPDRFESPLTGASRPDQLRLLLDSMAPALRDVIGDRWYAAQTGSAKASGPGLRPGAPLDLVLRTTTGGQPAVTMVDGRWPAGSTDPKAPVEAMLPVDVADKLGLRPGALLTAKPNGPDLPRARVAIVGTFRAVDPAAGIWDSLPSVLRLTPGPPDANPSPVTAVALTSQAGLDSRSGAHWPVTHSWRYRVAPDRLDAGHVTSVIDGIHEMDQQVPRGLTLTRGLEEPLGKFLARFNAALTVLSIITAGVLATLAGLVILAAGLAVRRRAAEFDLLRARGGAYADVAGRSLAESLLVIPLAAVAGWAIGLTVPGRPAGTGWLVLAATLIITLALPVSAVAARSAVGGPPQDLTGRARSTRRLTLEVSLLAVAALGTFLLRRRGLPPAGEIDPLLAAVPVLLAVAAAVVALRGYPWPLRLAGRIAARARGSVAFLGLARAARGAVTGPLIVVVVAVATAAFCGVVAIGIQDGRDRAADLAVPADALLTGDRFAPDTATELAAQPGVREIAPLVAQSASELFRTAVDVKPIGRIYVLAVDAPAFVRVAARSDSGYDVPGMLAAAAAGTGPVPALVSGSVAADLPGGGVVIVQGGRYEFRAEQVVSSFPTIPGDHDRFVVLPWQALRPAPGTPLTPTGFLVAASGFDRPALQRIGDEGQARYFTSGPVTGTPPVRPSVLTSRATVRTDLSQGGANGVLLLGFTVGVIGGAVLGLLAIAFAVLAGARARGRVLSRLRTMGLSRPQWRGLLIVELAPLIGAAMLTGAVAGVLIPLLLTPVLGLSTFTEGVPVRVHFEAGMFGGAVALGGFALAIAIAIEATINRRLRLGEVLRLGEES